MNRVSRSVSRVSPTFSKASRFQDPQELGLNTRINVSDLIDEKRPVMGHLQQPDFVVLRPGERSFLLYRKARSRRYFLHLFRIDYDEGILGAGLESWIARATSSFPVPVSPRTSPACRYSPPNRDKTPHFPHGCAGAHQFVTFSGAGRLLFKHDVESQRFSSRRPCGRW